MDRLCRKGPGMLWFDKDDQLQLLLCYNAEELHFVFLCLYPPLVGQKYQLCRAGGPGHHMIVPLAIDDEEMVSSAEQPFQQWIPSRKSLEGRVGFTLGHSVYRSDLITRSYR